MNSEIKDPLGEKTEKKAVSMADALGDIWIWMEKTGSHFPITDIWDVEVPA